MERRPYRIELKVENGTVIIGSDGHYWPGNPTTAHRAFVKFIRETKPKAVIYNGDALDGATVSRHSPIGWENRPTLADELRVCKERMAEIKDAAGKARTIWTLGNHDSRYETKLASCAPEYARVFGVHLKDHFPSWEPCWSVWINDEAVIKHRGNGGKHAASSNALSAGKTVVTGHTHQLQISAVPDYNGVRWGMEVGCLADTYGDQFVDYTEDRWRGWQAGFGVLTFRKGVLLQPELVRVHDGKHIDFRGSLIKV